MKLYCQWCSFPAATQHSCHAPGDCGPFVSREAMRQRNPRAFAMIEEREREQLNDQQRGKP